MKYLPILILLTISTFSCSTQSDTPEELAKKVFTSLQNNDSVAFSQLFMDKETYLEIVERGNYTPKTRQLLRDQVEHVKVPEKSYSNLQLLLSEGHCILKDVLIDSIKKETYNNSNLDFADVTIYFHCKEERFKIILMECVKSNDRWVIFGNAFIADPVCRPKPPGNNPS